MGPLAFGDDMEDDDDADGVIACNEELKAQLSQFPGKVCLNTHMQT